jgi:hypothetical protein
MVFLGSDFRRMQHDLRVNVANQEAIRSAEWLDTLQSRAQATLDAPGGWVAVLETCPCVMQEVDVALLKEILEDLAKLAIDEVLELPEENGGMPSNERDYSGRPEDFPMPVQFLATLLTDDCAAAVRMRKLLAKACGDGLLPSECVGEILADFWGDNEDDEYNLATHGTVTVVQMLDWLNDKWSADPDNSLLGWPGRCAECERGRPCHGRLLGATEKLTTWHLIGVDMAVQGTCWTVSTIMQQLRKRNLLNTARSREEFKALVDEGVWESPPTDSTAPLPALSTMSKAPLMALLFKVLQAEAVDWFDWELADVTAAAAIGHADADDAAPLGVAQLVDELQGFAVQVIAQA